MGAMPRQIEISVEKGEITVRPTAARLVLGEDTLQWVLLGAKSFLLTFADGEALDETEIRDGRVVTPRKKGIFHYQVAVCGSDGLIYLDASCPTVVIR